MLPEKAEAIKRLQLLKICSEAIKLFEEKDAICCSHDLSNTLGGILFALKPEHVEKVKAIEKTRNILVYHAYFAETPFGDMLSLLYVDPAASKYSWDQTKKALVTPSESGTLLVDAYVINLSEESFSEFGSIGIKPINGGITKIY